MKNTVRIIGWIDLDKFEAKKKPMPIKEVKEVTSECTMCGRIKYTSECSCEIENYNW